jgi:integral membrane protein
MKKYLRLAGFLEAFSCAALFMVAMPMKYYLGIPDATRIPGMIHGLLFLLYIALASKVADDEEWGTKQLLGAYFASFLPFGTLYYDRKYLQDLQKA